MAQPAAPIPHTVADATAPKVRQALLDPAQALQAWEALANQLTRADPTFSGEQRRLPTAHPGAQVPALLVQLRRICIMCPVLCNIQSCNEFLMEFPILIVLFSCAKCLLI